ncbi:hypothetical protein AB0H51_28155 [Streptomyces griseoluteus]|uniref:hypothetical protein n=1 Tax=Streptomyces griseoluteus TaxID=29306 RepID=UPI0033F57978
MTDTDHEGGQDAAALRAEFEVVFPPLRDLAAAGGGPLLNRLVGYAAGYADARLKQGNLPEARKQLDWLKAELIRQSRKGGPYVGGPFDGGHNPDGEIDGIQIRNGRVAGQYVLAEQDGRRVYRWEPEQA